MFHLLGSELVLAVRESNKSYLIKKRNLLEGHGCALGGARGDAAGLKKGQNQKEVTLHTSPTPFSFSSPLGFS